MNRIRDSFVKRLLKVYYGVDIKKMNGVLVKSGDDFFHKHYEISLKTGGDDFLIMKHYSGRAPMEWVLHSEKRWHESLDDFAFGMKLKSGEYLYFLSSGPWDIPDETPDKIYIEAVTSLESFGRECEPGLRAGIPFIPGMIRLRNKSIGFCDINTLAPHFPGYPLWGLMFGFGMERDRVFSLFESYYEHIGFPPEKRRKNSIDSLEEYAADNLDSLPDLGELPG